MVPELSKPTTIILASRLEMPKAVDNILNRPILIFKKSFYNLEFVIK